MLTYVTVGMVGLFIGIMLTQLSDIKQNIKRKAEKRHYRKLLNGTPKKVVHLTCWDDIYDYRKYPIYLDGKVLGISDIHFWHCNDNAKLMLDVDNKKVGYITNQIVRSQRLAKDRWKHTYAIALTKKPNFLGIIISPSAVIEVY